MFTKQLIIKYKEESNILKYPLNSPLFVHYLKIKVHDILVYRQFSAFKIIRFMHRYLSLKCLNKDQYFGFTEWNFIV